MIVAELDIMGIAVLESKADAPLIVDGDGILTRPIVLERVQPIPGWHAEVGEPRRNVDRFQLSQRATRHLDGYAFRLPGPEQLFGRAVREGLDHAEVYCIT